VPSFLPFLFVLFTGVAVVRRFLFFGSRRFAPTGLQLQLVLYCL
jgi:hypothetical protein